MKNKSKWALNLQLQLNEEQLELFTLKHKQFEDKLKVSITQKAFILHLLKEFVV